MLESLIHKFNLKFIKLKKTKKKRVAKLADIKFEYVTG